MIRGVVVVLGAALALACGPPSTSGQVPDTLNGQEYLTLRGPRAALRFVREDSLLAERVLELIEAQTPLPGLPDSVPSNVVAVLAHGPEAFDELTGGRVPEWRAGVAVPTENMLVVPSAEGRSVVGAEGRRTLRHEWAHLGLHAYLGPLRAPRWFDEGYAQWVSGGFEVMDAWRLRLLLALGRAPPMDSLELRWPTDREEARIAYLLAASAVTYLLEPGGERGLEIFLRRWRDQRSFEAALRETFGVTQDQFEEQWKRHVRARYGWLFVLSHSAIFWGVLAVVLLFMVRIRQRRNRERMARLRATDPPDQPAYWEVERDEGGPVPPPRGL